MGWFNHQLDKIKKTLHETNNSHLKIVEDKILATSHDLFAPKR